MVYLEHEIFLGGKIMSCIRYNISCAQHACPEYTTVNLYVFENNWVSLFKLRHNGHDFAHVTVTKNTHAKY